jgi:argininosuccinate synthase
LRGGELENPLFEVTDDVLQLVKTSAENSTEYITFEFKDGIPIAVDGKVMNLADLISYTNLKVGKHGVGLIDHIEDRVVGIKSREVYEAPAALAIIDSHMDLENMVLTRHELEFKQLVDMKWSWLIYCGLWFDPLRKDLDTFIDATQRGVTGKVRMKLQNRSMGVVGRESENSIYRNSLATYKSGSKFDQRLAKGFIELWGMQSVLANNLRAVPLEKEMCEQDKK